MSLVDAEYDSEFKAASDDPQRENAAWIPCRRPLVLCISTLFLLVTYGIDLCF